MKRMEWDDDQMRGIQIIDPSSRTFWRQMKRIGWYDQMGGIQTINQVLVHPGEDGIG